MADELLTVAAFTKVVVANRGAVAARIIRALRVLGVPSVAVFSDADSDAPYLEEADEAHHIGESAPIASYLNQEVILDVVRRTSSDGIHPGYGFLAENAEFAREVTKNGVQWIGPSPRWIDLMGDKASARDFARARGLDVGAGSDVLSADPEQIVAAGLSVGFPVLVKPVGGGGGIGMLSAGSPDELLSAVERASSMAARGFANDQVYLERLLVRPRHIEYQMLGDEHGNVCHLFERDCSVQRRRQKIIEEAPAPGLDRSLTDSYAARLAGILENEGYDNIGTVETLVVDGQSQFLEMNTRLQVEHGVTEEVTGIDLVQAQIRLASGELLSEVVSETPRIRGHAIEARVYAEDPVSFYPSPGTLEVFEPPDGVRVETGLRQGQEVTPFYDPLLAKVIAHGQTREQAVNSLVAGLEGFNIRGVKHNLPALISILRSEEFAGGELHTELQRDVMAASASTKRGPSEE